jgi:hypothetical protein
MTEAIKDYIAKLPSDEEKCWSILRKVGENNHVLDSKADYPLLTEQNVATFYLVGDKETVTDEESWEKTETFTITHLEFIDWGILPDDDDEDVEELTEEQVTEAVQEMVRELLDLEIGDYEHSYYNSFHGYNFYIAPLKDAIVVIRKGDEVTIA